RTALVAAALVMVATGLWIYSVYMKPVQNTLDCGTIACVDKIDLIQSKSMDNMDDDDLYELVNPADLEKKLNEKKEKINQNNTTDSSLEQLSTDALLDDI
ncbi:MAG: hypothetical protein IT236_09455, partial [Bacteroidia bacterium]|nr:hypothetical protein [Bacteroidia bacterium]